MWGKSGAPGRPRCWGRLLMTILFRRHTLSITARLTMLALSTALPLVALAGFAVLRAVEDERADPARRARTSRKFARRCGSSDQWDSGRASGSRRITRLVPGEGSAWIIVYALERQGAGECEKRRVIIAYAL